MATATDYVEQKLDQARPPELKPEGMGKVDERIKRGQERLRQVAPRRKECIAFRNNEHYVSLGKKGKLERLDTVPQALGGDKPDHRVRISRDLISPIVRAKRAALTQRVPGYESVATGLDSEDYSASKLAEKVAAGGYDLWELKRHHKRWADDAMVTEESFIRAFWDSSVGPFIQIDVTEEVMVDGEEGPELVAEPTGEKRTIGMGEVGVEVYSGQEVSWEPGVDFEDSRWFIIERARSVEDIEAEEGFTGSKLNADAEEADIPKDRKGSKLAMTTEYLERPCREWPEGRRLIKANGRVIFPEEAYPLKDKDGEVVDAPCLHRLTYDIDGSSDKGKGLVRSLIESMRQYDQAGNKILEWVQLMLVPQWIAEKGAMDGMEPDDTPGAVLEHSTITGGKPPEPRQPGQVPAELFTLQERAQQEMDLISFKSDLPAAKAESGKQAQTIVAQAAVAWEDFVEDFCVGAARLMRDILTLVQLHYTDERLVKFRGRTGWEQVEDFKGADIRGQTDIRVSKASIEPRTRQSNEQRIMNISQMFPGHFAPEILISALEGGSAEKLIEGYEDDVARANRVISMVRSGEFWGMGMRPVFPGEEGPKINPLTGEVELIEQGTEPVLETVEGLEGPEQVEVGQQPRMVPVMETELPAWMPRPFDNIPVQKAIWEVWMKTDDWANLDEAKQRASMDVYDGMLRAEARNAERQAQMQNQVAQSAGMENAAKRPVNQMPSQPAIEQ